MNTAKKSEYQQKSVFTLVVYFKNQSESRKFHSWKQDRRVVNNKEVQDERYSLQRLVDLVTGEWHGTYKTAIIFHNETDRVLMKWAYGSLKDSTLYKWVYKDTGDCIINIVTAEQPPEKHQKAVYQSHRKNYTV